MPAKATRYRPEEKRRIVRQIYRDVYVDKKNTIKGACESQGVVNESFYTWDVDERLWEGQVHPSDEFGVARAKRRRQQRKTHAIADNQRSADPKTHLTAIMFRSAISAADPHEITRSFLSLTEAEWPVVAKFMTSLVERRRFSEGPSP